MTSIADSNAIKDQDRVLPQHQAALTLLQSRLSSPKVTQIHWLDLACGRGQIILDLHNCLSRDALSKIHYTAYDINATFMKDTDKTAQQIGFASVTPKVGELVDFDRVFMQTEVFDFITFTNAIHEVNPKDLVQILTGCILRLNDNGILFVYDMERIQPPELGAVAWERDEIANIVRSILNNLGAVDYNPFVALWKHRSVNGWSFILERQHMAISKSDALKRAQDVIEKGNEITISILKNKFKLCRDSLETLTACGSGTAEEKEDKERFLYEYWAISRVLEKMK